MAYNDDAVLSKLSALNESHDSIATAAQWIMFHRRHSERTVQLWLTKLKDLPSHKRLNMIYLANEVVQQSKARHKDDFLRDFSPVITEATALAYRGASADIQNKVKRVVDVWRDRNIFEAHVQEAVESRLQEIDKTRSTAKASSYGGSGLGNSNIPLELHLLVAPQQKLARSAGPVAAAVNKATSEYERITGPQTSAPAPPVHAAQLNGLMRILATAEGVVTECVKARRELVDALEKLLTTNREALSADESHLSSLAERKADVEAKRHEVELAIMSGLGSTEKDLSQRNGHAAGPAVADSSAEPGRPKVEALTPPPFQDEADFYDQSPPEIEETTAQPAPTAQQPSATTPAFHPAPGIEMLSTLASQFQAVPINGANKKRKIDASGDTPNPGDDDGADVVMAEALTTTSQPAS